MLALALRTMHSPPPDLGWIAANLQECTSLEAQNVSTLFFLLSQIYASTIFFMRVYAWRDHEPAWTAEAETVVAIRRDLDSAFACFGLDLSIKDLR